MLPTHRLSAGREPRAQRRVRAVHGPVLHTCSGQESTVADCVHRETQRDRHTHRERDRWLPGVRTNEARICDQLPGTDSVAVGHRQQQQRQQQRQPPRRRHLPLLMTGQRQEEIDTESEIPRGRVDRSDREREQNSRAWQCRRRTRPAGGGHTRPAGSTGRPAARLPSKYSDPVV